MTQQGHITASEPSSRLHRNRPIASTVDLAKSVLGIWLFISAAVLAPHKTSSSYLHGAMFDGMLVGGLLIVGGIYAAARASATQQLTRTPPPPLLERLHARSERVAGRITVDTRLQRQHPVDVERCHLRRRIGHPVRRQPPRHRASRPRPAPRFRRVNSPIALGQADRPPRGNHRRPAGYEGQPAGGYKATDGPGEDGSSCLEGPPAKEFGSPLFDIIL